MAGMITVTFEPWQGHAAAAHPELRETKTLREDAVICTMRDGLRCDRVAGDLDKGNIVCLGRLFRVLTRVRKDNAAG